MQDKNKSLIQAGSTILIIIEIEKHICLLPFGLTITTSSTKRLTKVVSFLAACRDHDYTFVRSLGLCLKRHEDQVYHLDAEQTCQTEGADLMRMNTTERQTYLQNTLINVHRTFSFILFSPASVII